MAKKAVLLKSVLDVVSETGFLVFVKVRCLDTKDKDRQLSFWCAPDATAADVKRVLRERSFTAKACSDDNNLQLLSLKDAKGNHVFGRIAMAKPPLATELTVLTVLMDPHLKGLCSMAGMETEVELDEIMGRMVLPRGRRDCPGGHSLPTLLTSPTANNTSNGGRVFCDHCQSVATPGAWCETCQFGICNWCLENDLGRNTVGVDPYEQLADLVKYIGREHAQQMESVYLERPGSLGDGAIFWDPRLGGEVVPKIVDQDDRCIFLMEDSAILHEGTRLVVHLTDKLRSVLADQKTCSSDSCSQEEKTNALYPGETDMIIPKPTSRHGVAQYGRKLLREPESWGKVTAVLKGIAERAGIAGYEDVPDAYYLRMTLVSFETNKVVYHITAGISGSYCVSRPMVRGETIDAYFARMRSTADALQEAGALL